MIYTGSHRKKVKNLRKFHCILFTCENINKLGGRRKKKAKEIGREETVYGSGNEEGVFFFYPESHSSCVLQQ